MEASTFDELAFFGAIHQRGARALLIGRRALVVLGLPVLTADYDFWIHIDDIERFNEAAVSFGLIATCTPEEARRGGRYVLETTNTSTCSSRGRCPRLKVSRWYSTRCGPPGNACPCQACVDVCCQRSLI